MFSGVKLIRYLITSELYEANAFMEKPRSVLPWPVFIKLSVSYISHLSTTYAISENFIFFWKVL